MIGKDLIKIILDYGVERKVLVQRETIEMEIDHAEVIIDENGVIVIKNLKKPRD